MSFMDWIINLLADAADFFASIYHAVYDWPSPMCWAADLFYDLYSVFYELTYDFSDFRDWVNSITALVHEYGIWEGIKQLILWWLPGLEDAITLIENLVNEAKVFLADPITYLKDNFKTHVLPWAIVNIPLFGTLNAWYINFRSELETLFSNPALYLRNKFKDDILPWAIDNIPFISTLYVIYTKYAGEFGVFLDDPILWLKGKFEDDILPWAKENIPFFSNLTVLLDTITSEVVVFLQDPLQWLRDNTIWSDVEEFFTDPLQWLYDKMDEWFERFW